MYLCRQRLRPQALLIGCHILIHVVVPYSHVVSGQANYLSLESYGVFTQHHFQLKPLIIYAFWLFI